MRSKKPSMESLYEHFIISSNGPLHNLAPALCNC